MASPAARALGNLWKVAREEYLRLAAKRSFLLALIGMPVFIGAVVAIAIVTATGGGDALLVGLDWCRSFGARSV